MAGTESVDERVLSTQQMLPGASKMTRNKRKGEVKKKLGGSRGTEKGISPLRRVLSEVLDTTTERYLSSTADLVPVRYLVFVRVLDSVFCTVLTTI